MNNKPSPERSVDMVSGQDDQAGIMNAVNGSRSTLASMGREVVLTWKDRLLHGALLALILLYFLALGGLLARWMLVALARR